MLDIVLDVGKYLIWYYLLAIGIMILSIWASYEHKSKEPFMWGLTISVVIILLQAYIAPLLFGVLNYNYLTHTWQFVILGTYSVMWFGYIGLTQWNYLVYGEGWK